ncbi:MAG: DNA cytosine methyltransferase [Casimicrobium sp.]
MAIDVIDLFAGPGGLGEGFASLDEGRAFKIAVSVEMEASAHQTLTLRSFYRHAMGDSKAMRAYYDFCNSAEAKHPRDACPKLWKVSEDEARQLTLGEKRDNATLDQIIEGKRVNPDHTIVIGGPPCQAYSLVGRSKNQGTAGYVAEDDQRHYLYREYLRILHTVQPVAFVMENVKGILSSRVAGRRVFHDILCDLTHPGKALRRPLVRQGTGYRIYSLVAPTCFERGADPESINVSDFVVRSELYGIPQARHRVILLGLRDDVPRFCGAVLEPQSQLTVRDAIGGLPRLRSRISTDDSAALWERTIKKLVAEQAADASRNEVSMLGEYLSKRVKHASGELPVGNIRVGGYGQTHTDSAYLQWVQDSNLEVWLNHEARSHMASDLGRYFYAAAFAEHFARSPKGHTDFDLSGLSPNHANWKTGKFEDRFRVQLFGQPATTITSHIAKDGHYFIHPDASQCRSLTVREAARLQSFPDNYFLQGNRTQQYHQVGNAVPALLAHQIAAQVASLLKQ